jgi:hypothetical protein
VPDRSVTGQPFQDRPLVVGQLRERRGQVGRQLDPQLGRPPAQTRGMADGAADRVGSAEHVVAPEQGAGRELGEGGLDDIGGHVGQGGDDLLGRYAVGRGQQDDIEHLEGAGVELVHGPVHRHGYREAAGQCHDVRRRGTCHVGSGHQ